MNAQVEDISSTRKRLTFQVPGDVVLNELNSFYGEINRTARIPGFRTGKIPRSFLEKRFGTDAKTRVLEKVVPDYYLKVLKDAGLTPMAAPDIESEVDVIAGQPIDVQLTVEVRPQLDRLEYEGVELVEMPTEVTPEDMEKAIGSIRKDRASLEPAETAEADGHVVIDYKAYDGETLVDSVSADDFEFDLGSSELPPEFTSETIGRKAGDEYEFSVSYPEDHPGADVAGKTIIFKAVVKEVKKRVLPDFDDALAKDMGYEDAEELRNTVTERIRGMKEKRAFEIYRRAISEKLVAGHEFDVPETLLKAESDYYFERMKSMAGGGAELDEAAMRSSADADAVKTVKGRILVELIGEKEGVTLTDEDMKEGFNEMAMASGMHPNALLQYYQNNEDALNGLRSSVFETKVMRHVVSKARFVKENA